MMVLMPGKQIQRIHERMKERKNEMTDGRTDGQADLILICMIITSN